MSYLGRETEKEGSYLFNSKERRGGKIRSLGIIHRKPMHLDRGKLLAERKTI